MGTKNFTEVTIELASMEIRPKSSSGTCYDVIDLNLNQSHSVQAYQTPSLYIDKKVVWDVSRATVPNDPQKIVEWESLGQSKISSSNFSLYRYCNACGTLGLGIYYPSKVDH